MYLSFILSAEDKSVRGGSWTTVRGGSWTTICLAAFSRPRSSLDSMTLTWKSCVVEFGSEIHASWSMTSASCIRLKIFIIWISREAAKKFYLNGSVIKALDPPPPSSVPPLKLNDSLKCFRKFEKKSPIKSTQLFIRKKSYIHFNIMPKYRAQESLFS